MTTILVVDDERECATYFATPSKLPATRPNSPPTAPRPWICCADTTVTCASSTSTCPRWMDSSSRQTARTRHENAGADALARDSPVDVAKGLRYGADDYVRKPFSLEEILLRITAILRRSHAESTDDLILASGPIEMNVDTHEITVDEEPITLSATEFRLLEVLLERKDRLVTRELLLREVWNIDFDSEPRCSTRISRTCDERSTTTASPRSRP